MSDNLEQLYKQLEEHQDKMIALDDERAQHIKRGELVAAQLKQDLRDKEKASYQELQKTIKELTQNQRKFTDALSKSNGAVDEFRSAIMNTQFSFSNYTKTTSSLSKATSEMTLGFFASIAATAGLTKTTIGLRVATELATTSLTFFSENLLKQADYMLDAFDSIASIGGGAGLTTQKIEELGRNANFSSETLKTFGKLTKDQGSNLIAFGGNVVAGTERFSEFISVGRDQLKIYSRLGISQTQLAEYQGFYADNLIRSGRSIDRSADGMAKLRQSSLEYRDILLALSSVSGDTLEEQQKALDFAAQDQLFQAKLAQNEMEAAKLRDEASKLEAGASKDALLAEADRIDKSNELATLMTAQFSPDKVGTQLATAVLEMVSSGGTVVTENTAQLEMLFSSIGLSFRDVVQEISNFDGPIDEGVHLVFGATKNFASAIDETNLRLGPLATSFGEASREAQAIYGMGTEGLREAARLRNTSVEELINEYNSLRAMLAIEKENAERESKGLDPLPGGLLSDPVTEAREVMTDLGILFRDKFGEFFSGMLKNLTMITPAFEKVASIVGNLSPGQAVAATGVGSAAAGALGLLGTVAVGKAILNRIRPAAPAISPSPGSTPPAVTPTDTSDRRTTRERPTPTGRTIRTLEPSGGGGASGARPPAPAPARASKFTRLVQAVGKKYGSGAALKLAAQAGLMAVPGPGWILALINLGFNASLAWGIYQIWKEISGSAEDTSEDTITENATPIASMSTATNELTQSLAQLTGTDTEVGTIPTLTNSFDDLISTTDMLIEAFGSLRTSINSNNIASARTTPRPTDTGTSNVANIQPTTSRSFDSGTSSANMQTASIQSSIPRSFDSGTNVSEQEAKDFIANNEGIRYEPYQDTLGKWTVGVGHLIGKELPPEMNRRFSHQEVMDLFDSDYMHHRNAAERIPGFNRMDGLGQTALTDLTFNMGPSWINGWPNLANQLGEGDIPSASENLRNSRWYDQVGNRGPRVTNMLEDSTMISAAQGGIASGPETGYLGKLHGTELIQPINSDSVLSKLATTPESTSDANINSNEIQTKMSEMYRSNMALVETLNSKLDAMISRLDDGNYIQERILSNTV
jgi:lysozyme